SLARAARVPSRRTRPPCGSYKVHSGSVRIITALTPNFVLALALTLFATPALAQLGGGKVMRIVVPFAAGGAREVLARSFYSELGAALGQPVIVENRPGAGGAIGTASVAKAPPDGNTLVFAASSHSITALLSEHAPYDPVKDVAPVANSGTPSYA